MLSSVAVLVISNKCFIGSGGINSLTVDVDFAHDENSPDRRSITDESWSLCSSTHVDVQVTFYAFKLPEFSLQFLRIDVFMCSINLSASVVVSSDRAFTNSSC